MSDNERYIYVQFVPSRYSAPDGMYKKFTTKASLLSKYLISVHCACAADSETSAVGGGKFYWYILCGGTLAECCESFGSGA